MSIAHFDDLLAMARTQPTPQHLLLVFARAELPDDATEAQRRDFTKGHGGALVPAFCVALAVADVTSFDALKAQAAAMGAPWNLLFTAALGARPGQRLVEADIDSALDRMVSAIEVGQVASYLPFDPMGTPVQLR